MRAGWIRAERDSEVRQAARAWRKAGAIDDQTAAAVAELFPAPWPEPTIVWRILAFFFVTLAVAGIFGAFVVATRSVGAVAILVAALCSIAAEKLRPSPSGPASASGGAAAFWAVVCLMVESADGTGWSARSVTPLFVVGAAASAAAAWRWGYPAFAASSAAFCFLLLARYDGGRALWLFCAPVLAVACVPLLDLSALAPSHRRCAAWTLAVCLIAFYAAVNPYSVDRGLIEWVAPSREPAALLALISRPLEILGTVFLPLVLLAWSIRSRRVLLLDLGIVFAALSLATLRHYVPFAPLWAVLAAAGGVLIGLVLSVFRWLERAPGRQRSGFTADALFENEDGHQALGVAATALTLAPEPGAPPGPPGDFHGGGGLSGGGGASESF